MYDIDPSEFKKRRDQLMKAIGEDGVAILRATPEQTRSRDTEYAYRPASDMLYFTGFREPEAVAVFAPGHEVHFILFVRERDQTAEMWNGRRVGVEGARERFGADASHAVKDLEEELAGYLKGRETLYYNFGEDSAFDSMIFRVMKKLRSTRNQPPAQPTHIADIRDIAHELRVKKSPAELSLMRKAAEITSEAHIEAMKQCKPGMHEFELQAIIEHHFRKCGAEYPAYTSIVGAGTNATILHYTENRTPMKDTDVVLIDAGCEYHFYAADITRSFPVSGKFTDLQARVYQMVLDAQKAAVNDVKPGIRYDELQKNTVRRLTESLVELGALEGDIDELIEEKEHKNYYPHNVGHFLGIDVHDVGTYYGEDGEYRVLEPGMVLTIEPGLYFPDEDHVPEELRGLGIRIEDDILVTTDGNENLTATCPKEIDEIESLMGSA